MDRPCMAYAYTFHVLILVCSFTLSSCHEEVKVLTRVRKELNNPVVLDHWSEDDSSPCSWKMVICSTEGHVTELYMQNSNFSGEIPPQLGNLPNLQTRDLSYNWFSGPIPDNFGQIRTLRYLWLNNNNLSGPIPRSLAKIPQLVSVNMSFNNLCRPVPKFPAKTLSVLGNPLICGNDTTGDCSGSITSGPVTTDPKYSSTQRKPKSYKVAIALGISFSCLALVVFTLCLLRWWRKSSENPTNLNINDKQGEGLINLCNLRRFKIRDLQTATGNFNPKQLIGKGGCAEVYKGILGDGTVVAVKKLYLHGSISERLFKTEVDIRSFAVHRNLLRLLGLCSTTNEKLLVYPYMSNGSLSSRLREKPILDWNTRKQIAIGAARALVYLHNQCSTKILDRDVKEANVLLDEYYEAVLGDFGLARQLGREVSHVDGDSGTAGYIAPECVDTMQASEKSDVYSFGMLLLDMLTGMRAHQVYQEKYQKEVVTEWVKEVEELVDEELQTNNDQVEVVEMLQVAFVCIRKLPAERPEMSLVARMLQEKGIFDKWEASQHCHETSNIQVSSQLHPKTTNGHECSHFSDIQAMELSGPRS